MSIFISSNENKAIKFVKIFPFVIIILLFIFGNPSVRINNYSLKHKILSLNAQNEEIILFKDITPFKWDIAYAVEPYATKEEIEKRIGFKSASIQESVSEGMTNIIFVKDKRVIANIFGYPENLKFSLYFEDTATPETEFTLYNDDGITCVHQK